MRNQLIGNNIFLNIIPRASKEYGIETKLKQMKEDWETVEFRLPQFKKTNTSYVVGFDTATNLLDEHITLTQQLQASCKFYNFNKFLYF